MTFILNMKLLIVFSISTCFVNGLYETWTQQISAGNADWLGITSDSSGQLLAATIPDATGTVFISTSGLYLQQIL